jgi:putative transposase
LFAVPHMPRKPRQEVAGGVHHVFARGNDRRDIYLDDVDRHAYLAILGQVIRWKRWLCLAYCLMPNHVHLLLETPHENLGAGMQTLHGSYAQRFNERHGRVGHLFQGRFGSVHITSDEQLWTTIGYVALNPVRAGLCEEAEGWAWSSHAATLGDQCSPPWLDVPRLLSYFEGLGGNPMHRYAAMTEADRAPAAATVSRR